MLNGFISSKTKINIIIKLFLNPATKAYLRQLASEFNVSTNSVRTELNSLTENKILISERDGRNVFYRANTSHPLFPEFSSMVRKITGIDELVKSVVGRLGQLKTAYLVGDYARGIDSGIIDLVLVGNIDHQNLYDITQKTEKYIKRKIRTLVLSKSEFSKLKLDHFDSFLKLWEK